MSTSKILYCKLLLVYLLKLPLVAFTVLTVYVTITFVMIGIAGGPGAIVFVAVPYLFGIGLVCFAVTFFMYLMAGKLRNRLSAQYAITKRQEITAALTIFVSALVIMASVVFMYAVIWSNEDDKLQDYDTTTSLEDHADAINNYGKLPATLSEMGDQYYQGQKPVRDAAAVQYRLVDSGYELCATFLTDTTHQELQYYPAYYPGTEVPNLNWHEVGLNCYSLRLQPKSN